MAASEAAAASNAAAKVEAGTGSAARAAALAGGRNLAQVAAATDLGSETPAARAPEATLRWWAPVGVLLLAAVLRFWALDRLPPGLFYDESANGIDALRVLAGSHPVFFTGDQGREPFFIYMQALAMLLIGPSPLALRLPAAVLGVLAVAATYATFRAFAGQAVGLIGSFLLAASFWHVSLSRLAFRTIALPLFDLLAVFWLWKGVSTGRARYFAAGGVCLGLALYTYLPARLAPVLIGAWLFGCLVFPAWRRFTPAAQLRTGMLVAGVAAALTVAPLAVYFAGHPQDFLERVQNVAGANVGLSPVEGFGLAVRALVWSGDPNPRQDLPDRPLVDLSLTACAALGLLVTGRRWRTGLPVLVLAWCLAMLAPAALSTEPAHALRLAGELPWVLFFPAVGLAWLAPRRWPGHWPSGALVAGAILLLSGVLTVRDYFLVWPAQPTTATAFQADLLESLDLVPAHPAGPVLVSSDFYQGEPIPLRFEPTVAARVRGFDARTNLVLPADTGRPVDYIIAPSFAPTTAIPFAERLIPQASIVDSWGRPAGTRYLLASPYPDLTPPRPFGALIAGAVTVRGADVPALVHPGQSVRVALYWTARGTLPPGHWEFFAHLVGHQGQQLLAQDYNQGFPPSQWRPGDQVISWFTLALPATAPATVADVDFGLFDADTGRRLLVTSPAGQPAGNAILVGPLRIDRPAAAPPPPEHPLNVRFGDSIKLQGYDLAQEGSQWVVRLHWQGTGAATKDYTVFAHTLDAQGRFLAAADSQPGNGAFPTSTWAPGETILDEHRLPVNPRATQIEVGLYLLASGQRLPVAGAVTGTTADAIRLPLPGGAQE